MDCDFIISMLYLNAYRLNNGLFYVTSMQCFTVCGSIVCQNALVILCIKRLLIDRLNVGGLGEHVTDHVLIFFSFILGTTPSLHRQTGFDDLYVI